MICRTLAVLVAAAILAHDIGLELYSAVPTAGHQLLPHVLEILSLELSGPIALHRRLCSLSSLDERSAT